MSNEKQSYWERRHTNRTLKNVYAMEKNSKEMIKAINQVYENTAKSINKEIDNIYRNYVKSNDVGEDLAKEYLTNAEKHRYIKMLEKEINSTTNPTYKKELIAKYNAGSAIYRMSRLENLKQSIQVKIQKTSAIEEELQRIHYKKVIKDGIKKPSIFKLKKKKSDAFNTVNKHVVNETLKTKWEYGDFSENIWKNNKKLIEVMDNVLKPGFLRGKSTAVLARKVNQIMGAGQFNATRLVRTESTRYFNLASLESFKEMGVKEYQILAVLDSRTSKICHKQDKRIYKIEEAKAGITLPPFHPFCRSTIIPVIDDNIDKEVLLENSEKEYKEELNYKLIEPQYIKRNNEPKLSYLEYSEEKDKRGILTKFYVKDRDAFLDTSIREKEVANILVEKYGISVDIRPAINPKYGIPTSDYIINGKKWDLKSIEGKGKWTIENRIKKKEKQANSFIIDLDNTIIDEEMALERMDNIFKKYQWLENIIIFKYNEIKYYLKRKK